MKSLRNRELAAIAGAALALVFFTIRAEPQNKGGGSGQAKSQAQARPTPLQQITLAEPVAAPQAGFSTIGGNAAPALNTSSWTLIGPAPLINGIPFSGRLAGVAADPLVTNTIYIAAAGGGVWKTTDQGTTWTPLTDTQQTLAMGAIAVAPSNGQVIYAGTGEANNSADSQSGRGILKSIDGGTNWTLNTGPSGIFATAGLTTSKIAIDPTNPNIAYAAMGNVGQSSAFLNGTGVYKTANGGTTWVNVTAANGKTIADTWSDVAVDPTTPSTVYAAVGTIYNIAAAGVYKSTDSGATWNILSTFPNGATNVGRTSIAIAKSNSQVVYVSTSSNSTSGVLRLARSDDGGATSNTLTVPNYMGGQGWYDQWIAVDPTNSAIAYVAGAAGTNSVLRTINSGVNWTDIHIGTNGITPHVDHHGVAFDASGVLLDANDGGIFRLTGVSPVTWADLNGNLATNQFVGVAAHPTDANIAIGGTQDNGTNLMTGGNLVWTETDGGDGGRVRFNLQAPANLLRVSPVGSFGTANFFRRSTNTGASWSSAVTGLNGSDSMNFYPPFVIEAANGNHALFGSNKIYETTNFATSWSVLGTTGLATTAVDAVAIAPSDPNNTFYVAQGGTFASSSTFTVTNNHGASWTTHNLPAGNGRIADIIVEPSSASTVYVVVSTFDANGHVFKSTNSGTTWTSIGTVGGGLPDLPTWTIRKDPTTANLYVGNDIGVYRSTNDGASWTRFGAGLPNVQVQDLDLNAGLAILTAGTYGRSNWQIQIPPPATNVTAQFTISNNVVSFNRLTGFWTQTVSMTNNGAALSNVAYVLDNLIVGWTLTNGDGTTSATSPAGSPFKIVGAVGSGATATFTLQFARTGTPAFGYGPLRVLEGTSR